MRVLTLCYEYPPLGGGGGRVAQSVARALAARGHDVRVQTAALGWCSAEENDGGVAVFRTRSGRAKADTCRVHEMAAYCATSFFPTLRHIRRWRPDVIHAHFAMPTGMLAWAVHKLTRTPYVITAHLGDVPGGVPEQTEKLFRIAGPLARRVWARAAGCTAVSSFVKELAEGAYSRPVECVLNGVDLSGRPPPPEPRTRRRLVFVGRLSVQKNPTLLLDALVRLTSRDWELTIVGDGPLMSAVRSRITTHKLTEFVTLAGWLDAPGVARVLAESDVLVMPSLSEGLPVAAVEALKHGLAIVASDIPGMRDVLSDGVNGFTAPVSDAAAFAEKIGFLLQNESTLIAMKHASWEKALVFDLSIIAEQYERMLKAACRS